MQRFRRHTMILLSLLLLVPVLAACDVGGGDDGETINIGWIPWDEDIAATYLWQHILEEEGYEVELTQLEAALAFSGLAEGDIDLFLDVWLPTTHEDYWLEYGDNLEDLGVWYEEATLEIAVPSYVEVNSLAELSETADTFDSTIVGIEPSAGMMGIAREDILPGYGLDDWTLTESSSPAMLAELDSALNSQEPIAVTLWTPHWAYAAYDIKNLEDPEGLWGGSEQLHVAGRPGFTEDFEEVAGWMGSFQMPADVLANLEVMIREAGEGNEGQAVEDWLAQGDNQAMVDGWIS